MSTEEDDKKLTSWESVYVTLLYVVETVYCFKPGEPSVKVCDDPVKPSIALPDQVYAGVPGIQVSEAVNVIFVPIVLDSGPEIKTDVATFVFTNISHPFIVAPALLYATLSLSEKLNVTVWLPLFVVKVAGETFEIVVVPAVGVNVTAPVSQLKDAVAQPPLLFLVLQS